MLKRIVPLLALALIGAVGLTADGAIAERAVYEGLSIDGGLLHIEVQPCSRIAIRGERADGSYETYAKADVDSTGLATFAVAHAGPTSNGQPQYIVSVMHLDGSTTRLCAVAATSGSAPDDLWWLD